MNVPAHALFIPSEHNMKVNVIKNYNPNRSQTNTSEVEDYLNTPRDKQLTELLGKHSFAFWMLFILLLILAAGNLIITIIIFGVLQLGKGMQSLEIIPETSSTKFLNAVHLDNIIKQDGKLEGYGDTPTEIEIPNSSFFVNLLKNYHPSTKLKFNNNGIAFTGVEHMDIIDPSTKEKIFQTDYTNLKLTQVTKNLISNSITTNKIASPIDRDLNLHSNGKLHIQGTEGLHIESSEIFWSADQDIHLDSLNGSVILKSKEGIFIDTQNMPLMTNENKSKLDSDYVLSYKLCICMPQGKLFRVPVLKGYNPRGLCTRIKMDIRHNPCI